MLLAARRIERVIDESLQAGEGLTSPEFAVLVCLSEAPETTLRLRDLCLQLDWDRSRTSHQVTRMERRGLVSKCTCPGDARGVLVKLTATGDKRLKEAVPAHVETVRRLVFDQLRGDQRIPVAEFLQSVVEESLKSYPPQDTKSEE